MRRSSRSPDRYSGAAATRLPRLVGPLLVVLGLVLVPWIWYLASRYFVVPHGCSVHGAQKLGTECFRRTHTSISHRDLGTTWVGFDIAEAVMLILTGVLAFRRSDRVQVAAVITATLLFVDFWFDFNLARRNAAEAALFEGLFAELPLGLACSALAWWVGRARRHRQAGMPRPDREPAGSR